MEQRQARVSRRVRETRQRPGSPQPRPPLPKKKTLSLERSAALPSLCGATHRAQEKCKGEKGEKKSTSDVDAMMFFVTLRFNRSAPSFSSCAFHCASRSAALP